MVNQNPFFFIAWLPSRKFLQILDADSRHERFLQKFT